MAMRPQTPFKFQKLVLLPCFGYSTDFYHRIPLHSIYDRRIRIMRRIYFEPAASSIPGHNHQHNSSSHVKSM
jgi:hypothetical protein